METVSIVLLSVKIVFYFAIAVACLTLVPILYQVYKIVQNFRRISDRIELVSDFRGWLDIFREFSRKNK